MMQNLSFKVISFELLFHVIFFSIHGKAVLIEFIDQYFVCLLGFNVAFKYLIIATRSTCSSYTLTNVLPHRNGMPQTHDMTSHPVTVYRHGADLSLCYQLMLNVKPEYKATHFNVFGKTRPGNPSYKSWSSCRHDGFLNVVIHVVLIFRIKYLLQIYMYV